MNIQIEMRFIVDDKPQEWIGVTVKKLPPTNTKEGQTIFDLYLDKMFYSLREMLFETVYGKEHLKDYINDIRKKNNQPLI